MDKGYESKYHLLEEQHWWFEARRDLIFRFLQDKEKNISILDVGCSGGALIRFLKSKGFQNITGIDQSSEAVAACIRGGLNKVFQMDGADPQFPVESFDMIVASDILEHIEHDGQALERWYSILKPRGTLVVLVPAFPFLWSDHDVANHHFRRYSKRQLANVLKNSKVKIERISYANLLLFFPAFGLTLLQRLWKRRPDGRSDRLVQVPPWINRLVLNILKAENTIVSRVDLLLGLNLLAVIRK